MLTPVLDPHASHPLYEQIYRHIRREIEGGVLRPGERLPSKRALAAHLKVGVITVENAYEQLLAEGYVYTRAKRGFFVQSPDPGVPPLPAAPSVLPPPPPTRRAVLPYDFSTNAVDTEHFPFSTWARLMREVLSEEDSALLSSPHPQGVPALRAAIVRSLHDFRGIDVHPDQIVVGAGAEYLTTLLFQLLGQCGGWAVEDPGYRKVQRILSHTGALVCPIPLDPEGLRTDALRWSGARVVHVTPSHHFPLGTVMSMPRREALLRWAGEQPDRYIIEDDYDSEFRFDGRPVPALQSLDRDERVIYLNTFAKSLAPSLRIGYMVLPPHLIRRYREEFLLYSSTVPSFEQYTLARFLERGHFERHIRRMRTIYRQRRDALVEAADAAGLLEWGFFSGMEAGLHLLFHVSLPVPERALVEAAGEAGVGVSPLSAYSIAPLDTPGPVLVLGYGRLDPAGMVPAMERLAAAWRPLISPLASSGGRTSSPSPP